MTKTERKKEEILFNSRNLKITIQIGNKSDSDLNQQQSASRTLSASASATTKLNSTYKINLISFDKNIFFALNYLVCESTKFRISLFKLFDFFVNEYLVFLLKNRGLAYQQHSLVNLNFIEFLKFIKFVQFDLNAGDYKIKRNFKLNLNANLNDLIEHDEIIRTWSSIVLSWCNKRVKYIGHWAYFSTLGGAYSSLGEDSIGFAKNAEKISIKQLALAQAFNDPNAICRCKIYLSFSYTQLGKFKDAEQLLRNQYEMLTNENNKEITDEHLIVMCIAGLNKLKYAKSKAIGYRANNG